ncbi:hypothetical protein FRC00_008661 [Tulasnella sp. 408]|nr:hypothetical protein FRC00_008661 [Tulasnella sp. 408]
MGPPVQQTWKAQFYPDTTSKLIREPSPTLEILLGIRGTLEDAKRLFRDYDAEPEYMPLDAFLSDGNTKLLDCIMSGMVRIAFAFIENSLTKDNSMLAEISPDRQHAAYLEFDTPENARAALLALGRSYEAKSLKDFPPSKVIYKLRYGVDLRRGFPPSTALRASLGARESLEHVVKAYRDLKPLRIWLEWKPPLLSLRLWKMR